MSCAPSWPEPVRRPAPPHHSEHQSHRCQGRCRRPSGVPSRTRDQCSSGARQPRSGAPADRQQSHRLPAWQAVPRGSRPSRARSSTARSRAQDGGRRDCPHRQNRGRRGEEGGHWAFRGGNRRGRLPTGSARLGRTPAPIRGLRRRAERLGMLSARDRLRIAIRRAFAASSDSGGCWGWASWSKWFANWARLGATDIVEWRDGRGGARWLQTWNKSGWRRGQGLWVDSGEKL